MAGATLNAGEYFTMEQRIEGQRMSDLLWGTANAKQVVLSFRWHPSPSAPRSIAVAIRNGAANRSYVTSFASPGNSTPFLVTLVIPGDTTGTWAVDNTPGMIVAFSISTGLNFVAPVLNAWQAGNYLGITNTTGGTSSTMGFSEIGLYADPSLTGIAPPFERPSDRQVMFDCQRYWQKCMGATGLAYNVAASTHGRASYMPQVPMRTTPTSTQIGTARAWDQATAPNITAMPQNYCSATSFEWNFSSSAVQTLGRAAIYLDGSPTIYIAQSARM